MYLTHSLIGFLLFILLRFERSLYILNACQFSDAGFANIFPSLLFVSLFSSQSLFFKPKFFILMKLNLSF